MWGNSLNGRSISMNGTYVSMKAATFVHNLQVQKFKNYTMIKNTLLALFIFTFGTVFSQNMNEGFNYLELGSFNKAEIYFQKVLQEYPDNKTATLCYGRAVGLNGKPEKALAIFKSLLNKYPGDLEIQLNYAESLLWGKQFEKAKGYYLELMKDYSDNFTVLLGLANTYSNLKDYENAMKLVNRALEVKPENKGAMTSKKYIRLGYAYRLSQEQEYEKSIKLLEANLIEFTNDRETLLNMANVYLIVKQTDNANKAYRLMAVNASDSIVALNGMALAAHIDGNEKLALQLASQAKKSVFAMSDTTLTKNTEERFVQALIWNKKFKQSESEIQKLLKQYGEENWVLALRATLGMYLSNFKQSIADYTHILNKDSASFDGNLGIANAFFAAGRPEQAYQAVDQTLKVFEKQKDATEFLSKLNSTFTPVVDEKLSYSFDNGKNFSITSSTAVNFPVSTKLAFQAGYQYRRTGNSNNENKASTNNFKLGINYQLFQKTRLIAKAGVLSATASATNYNKFLGEFSAKLQPAKLQDLEVGYKLDVQNYNAELINRNISTNHFFVNYNLGTNFGLGWFNQYFHTTQSDGNTRNLLFTSLYYNFMTNPVLKAGINYQTIGFKNQVPSVYFSPKQFNAFEVFVDFLKDEAVAEKKSWFYTLNGATGIQLIEKNSGQFTYRIQAKLGYKFSKRLLVNVYGLQSNIASASVAGFTYTELGMRVKWLLGNKPLFLKKAN